MKFTRRYPSNQILNNFVKSYWKLEIETTDIPFSQLYFPYGSFELVYYLKNRGVMQYVGSKHQFMQPKVCYSGQFIEPFFLSFNKGCICFGVSLKPWAGNVLFDIPSNKFTDEMIELPDLGENYLILEGCKGDDEIFSKLESYLIRKINFQSLDKASAYLAQLLLSSPSRETASHCIAQIGLSRRRVEQKFLTATGLSMGCYSRKVRFQKAVQMLSGQGPIKSLTSLGLDAGYYDQSHFISEFREFTSITPSTYLKQKNDLQNFLASLAGSD